MKFRKFIIFAVLLILLIPLLSVGAWLMGYRVVGEVYEYNYRDSQLYIGDLWEYQLEGWAPSWFRSWSASFAYPLSKFAHSRSWKQVSPGEDLYKKLSWVALRAKGDDKPEVYRARIYQSDHNDRASFHDKEARGGYRIHFYNYNGKEKGTSRITERDLKEMPKYK